jgi:mRNA-degrading endonuclease YafQ of YafQ-DinJ toxin-antitoxin module
MVVYSVFCYYYTLRDKPLSCRVSLHPLQKVSGVLFKKLAKNYRSDLTEQVSKTLEVLLKDPYPRNCRQEPLPGSLKVRLIYLVNESQAVIQLIWIYSHEQFKKRPADRDLQRVIEEILEE